MFSKLIARAIYSPLSQLWENGAGALMVGSFINFVPMREKIIALAEQYKIPVMYPSAIYTRAGGLMSYTADQQKRTDCWATSMLDDCSRV